MKKKVLFIEDDQMFANIYRNKLVLDGFEVEIASDGEAGLELLRQFKPRLIPNTKPDFGNRSGQVCRPRSQPFAHNFKPWPKPTAKVRARSR
jgi:hypothetical protein